MAGQLVVHSSAISKRSPGATPIFTTLRPNVAVGAHVLGAMAATSGNWNQPRESALRVDGDRRRSFTRCETTFHGALPNMSRGPKTGQITRRGCLSKISNQRNACRNYASYLLSVVWLLRRSEKAYVSCDRYKAQRCQLRARCDISSLV